MTPELALDDSFLEDEDSQDEDSGGLTGSINSPEDDSNFDWDDHAVGEDGDDDYDGPESA